MSLKRRFASGALWAVIGNGINNIIGFIVFAIIARAVSAEVLGIAAFTIVMLEVGRIVASAGIPDLLVQRPEWDEDYAMTAFCVNIAIAIILTVFSCLVLAPILDVHFARGSGGVMIAMSACYVIDAARVVHESKLRREFKYKNLAARGLAAGTLSGIIGIAMALNGFDIWALIAQRIASATFFTVFSWIASDWRPRLFFKPRELVSMLVNGTRLMGAATLASLAMRVPDLVLGSVAGPAAVALYRVGARGFEALHQLLIIPLATTAMGAFSRLEAPAMMAASYLRATTFLAFIAYPAFFGAAAIAEPFVFVAFGPEWQDSAMIMSVLSLMAGPAVLAYMMYPALASQRRTREILWINVSVVITATAVCLIFAPLGPLWVAVALAVRSHLASAANLYVLRRLIGVKPLALIKAVLPPYLGALIMVGAIVAVDRFLLAGHAPWSRTIVMVLIGAAVYPLALRLFWRQYLFGALSELGQMFPPIERVFSRLASFNFKAR